MTHRLLEVDAARLPRWVAGFGERHGEVVVAVDAGTVRLSAADGAVAVLEPLFPVLAATGPTVGSARPTPSPTSPARPVGTAGRRCCWCGAAAGPWASPRGRS